MNRFFNSSFFVFILILALIGLISAVGKESYRRYQIDKEVAGLKQEIKQLKEENESLVRLLTYLSSDRSLEREARLKLNLLKEGEKVVIINSGGGKVSSSSQTLEGREKKEISNFEKWCHYLFDKDFSK